MSRPTFLATALLLLACATRGPAPAPGGAAEARRQEFDRLVTETWDETLRLFPELGTFIGDRRFEDRWSDLSERGQAERVASERAFLARFEAFDPAPLDDQRRLTRELAIRQLRLDLEGERFESWKMPVNQMDGAPIMAPQLAVIAAFRSAKDYEAWTTRLRRLPKVLGDVTEDMRLGVSRGLVLPRYLADKVAQQAERLAGAPPEASPFAAPLASLPKDMPGAEQERLRGAMLAALRDDVLPAYRKFATFVRDEYAPKGRPAQGYWALPDGAARYAYLVRVMTTTNLTPDQIHEMGLREVARIEGEMLTVARARGFSDLASFNAALEKDPAVRPASREAVLQAYRDYIAAMTAKLPRLFGRLPRATCEVKPVEEFREKETAGAQYVPPAQDGSRGGIVQVNTGDFAKRKTITFESTAYHEGVPGHHLQLAIAQELGELPPLRRYMFFTAFIEGWALYSESLGKEVGMYADPLSDYGRLQDEMLRAIRLVVDTGVHARRWTREQMIDYFHAHSALDAPDVEAETDRYISNPAQALAYMVGRLAILKLRERARGELGERFDLRKFHDAVLGGGALPLDVLESRIGAWIAAQKAQAVAYRNSLARMAEVANTGTAIRFHSCDTAP